MLGFGLPRIRPRTQEVHRSFYTYFLLGLASIIVLHLLRQGYFPPKPSCPYKWAGDAKNGNIKGSCWCSVDEYCLCSPSLAIDTLLEAVDDQGRVIGVVLVKRKDNGKRALVGGFVDVGETTEDAVRREVLEETGLVVTSLKLFPHIYSDPARDPRRHTVSIIYICRFSGSLEAGDDAAGVDIYPIDIALKLALTNGELFFDHSKILLDYLKSEGHYTEP